MKTRKHFISDIYGEWRYKRKLWCTDCVDKFNIGLYYSELAAKAKLKDNNEDRFVRLSRIAFKWVRRAALYVAQGNLEPTRGVWLRRAALLAIDAKEYAEAERMCKIGLEKKPQEPVDQDLRNLLIVIRERINS